MAKSPDIIQKFITAEMKATAGLPEPGRGRRHRHQAHPGDAAGARPGRDQADGLGEDLQLNSFTVDQITQAIKFLTDTKLITGTVAAKDVTETKFADEAVKALGAFTAP